MGQSQRGDCCRAVPAWGVLDGTQYPGAVQQGTALPALAAALISFPDFLVNFFGLLVRRFPLYLFLFFTRRLFFGYRLVGCLRGSVSAERRKDELFARPPAVNKGEDVIVIAVLAQHLNPALVLQPGTVAH